MDGIQPEGKTPAGIFSTKERFAIFKGKIHFYPKKSRIRDVEQVLDGIIHNYNTNIENLRKLGPKPNELFACIARLVSDFLSQHPFSDGNGRLARLLGSYSLMILTQPFVFPITQPASGNEQFIQRLQTKNHIALTQMIAQSYQYSQAMLNGMIEEVDPLMVLP